MTVLANVPANVPATVPATMRAMTVEATGGDFVLKKLPVPAPQAGQVLVRIVASGVNPLDTKIRAGQAAHAQQPLPAGLGLDLAGVVVAVGTGVSTFRPGDEVYGAAGGVGGLQGTLAEYAAVDARLVALKPQNLTMREAAALPLVAITAWEGLVDRANVAQGDKVLVHGGAGGVGHIAVQLARARGAQVFTTVAQEQFAIAERFGAVPIDYRSSTIEDYVARHTGGAGFDVVFDTVGGATLDASFSAARHYGGHVLSILGWGSHKLAPLSFRSATYSGVFTLYPMISGQGREHHGDILREAAKLVEAGRLMPLLDSQRFDLGSALAAHQRVESGVAHGKVVVDIAAG
ncbi:MAG: zinc-dependent alcohol dehydrogenase family protein [Polaromonas sp.]|uniref:zinc-dependent alcohol dehydrogenase family protein n=1 Tax=Polaromonas sp. TaxID=1869339 RepID=UPI003267A49D